MINKNDLDLWLGGDGNFTSVQVIQMHGVEITAKFNADRYLCLFIFDYHDKQRQNTIISFNIINITLIIHMSLIFTSNHHVRVEWRLVATVVHD